MLSSEQKKELIEEYLKGKLNPDDLSVVEENLRTDVVFKNELELQKSIVATLQANRKAELKNRLNQIEVNAGTQDWWKYAAVAGLITGFGIWFYAGNTDKTSSEIVVNQETSPAANTSNTIQEKYLDPIAEQSTVSSTENSETKTTNKEVTKSVVAKNGKKSSDRIQKEEFPSLPNLHSPEGESVHEPLSKELNAPDHHLTKTPHLGASVAGVEVVKSKKHKFHYRYFDNKLFLYGNFDANTYDILELNTSKGQSFYLKFENNYYALEANKTEISKLEQVKDHQTTKELEELQKK